MRSNHEPGSDRVHGEKSEDENKDRRYGSLGTTQRLERRSTHVASTNDALADRAFFLEATDSVRCGIMPIALAALRRARTADVRPNLVGYVIGLETGADEAELFIPTVHCGFGNSD
ncbi:hypothetical protein JHW43_006689 [Diplocarpon mali]|nr:hypothetical protein JHW43_006689 [Diplocarpon mali]